MPENPFDYSGHLVFSVFIAHSKQMEPTQSNFFTDLLQRLPKYTEGYPDDPGNGYSKIRLNDQTQFETELPEWMLKDFESWNCIRYFWEKYNQREAFVDGKRREVQIPTVETVDLFFHSTGLTLVRGKASSIHRVMVRIQQAAEGDVLFDRIKIDVHKIVEILKSNNNLLSEDFYLNHIRKAVFDSCTTSTGEFSIKGSDILSSAIGQDINKRGQIISLNGDFQFSDFTLSANIKSDKIFVRTNDDIKHLSPASRLIISIIFCFRLLEHQDRIRNEVF